MAKILKKHSDVTKLKDPPKGNSKGDQKHRIDKHVTFHRVKPCRWCEKKHHVPDPECFSNPKNIDSQSDRAYGDRRFCNRNDRKGNGCNGNDHNGSDRNGNDCDHRIRPDKK